MLIYMDTCCFNRPYDDQSLIRNSLEARAKLHIQSRIRSGHIRFDDEGLERLNAAALARAAEHEARAAVK